MRSEFDLHLIFVILIVQKQRSMCIQWASTTVLVRLQMLPSFATRIQFYFFSYSLVKTVGGIYEVSLRFHPLDRMTELNVTVTHTHTKNK